MQEMENRLREVRQQWRDDWNIFARDVLGANLDPEQQEILSSVQTDRRVSVVSGTSRGKDYVAAVAAMCFFYLTPTFKNGQMVENTKVALTAPTGRQVSNIMIPEISRLFRHAEHNFGKLPGNMLNDGIRTKFDEWFLTGFKADAHNHEAWTGFHAVNTMFVVTEASGIPEDIFTAIEGNLQGNSRLLLVFNANNSTGYAARSQSLSTWTRFRLNSLTAPNVLEKKMVIPGQVDYEWIEDKLNIWCTKIRESEKMLEEDDFEFEGQWYRPSDTFRIKILGKFPAASEDTLVPIQWIQAANERWQNAQGDERQDRALKRGTRIIGSDIAGMGRDDTVECHRFSDYVEKFVVYNSGGEANHTQTAGALLNYLRENSETYVSIDTIGEGAGVYSMVQEDQSVRDRAISCKYSAKATDQGRILKDVTEQYEFLNMRAYLFWAVRDWLDPKNGSKAMVPPNDRFLEEVSQIRWFFTSSGKIQIESKEDIKKRLGRSLDTFDALANTFHPLPRKTFVPTNILW